MNIQGYGSGSFVDIMNSSHKRNQIPLVNQIVSYKDTEDGRAIGVTAVGNIGYVARYADSSTPENPVIKIGDYEVLVNEVDPHNATQLEMFALLSYFDDTNQTNNTGMSSFSKLRSFAEIAEMNGLCEDIKDVNSFYNKTQNWEEIMCAIKKVFLGNPQTYEQALNCDKLIDILG